MVVGEIRAPLSAMDGLTMWFYLRGWSEGTMPDGTACDETFCSRWLLHSAAG